MFDYPSFQPIGDQTITYKKFLLLYSEEKYERDKRYYIQNSYTYLKFKTVEKQDFSLSTLLKWQKNGVLKITIIISKSKWMAIWIQIQQGASAFDLTDTTYILLVADSSFSFPPCHVYYSLVHIIVITP